jgi:hypothetical protein
MVERSGAPVHCCNDAENLGELVHVFGSAPGRKHVVCRVIDVVPNPVVGITKCLYMPLCFLDRDRISQQRRT